MVHEMFSKGGRFSATAWDATTEYSIEIRQGRTIYGELQSLGKMLRSALGPQQLNPAFNSHYLRPSACNEESIDPFRVVKIVGSDRIARGSKEERRNYQLY